MDQKAGFLFRIVHTSKYFIFKTSSRKRNDSEHNSSNSTLETKPLILVNETSGTELGLNNLLSSQFLVSVGWFPLGQVDLDIGQALESLIGSQLWCELLRRRVDNLVEIVNGLLNIPDRVDGRVGEVVAGQLGQPLEEL